MSGTTARRRVLKVPVDGVAEHRADLLAAEEPLEIRVDGEPLTVTMRTPGDDIDLAAGFLFTEGLLPRLDAVHEIRMCDDNVAAVTLKPGQESMSARVAANRNFLTTSACGVCGKDSIEAIRVRSAFDVASDPVRVSPAVLAGLPDRLRQAQRVFSRTGGLHAAGLFGPDGTLLVLREDVGRHNAVDKVAGWALRSGRLPLAGHVLLVSGRASFELAQKAVMIGVPVLAAVSAPSSLAASLAEESGLTLVGFLRGTTMNVYAGEHRVVTEPRSRRPAAFRAAGGPGPLPRAAARVAGRRRLVDVGPPWRTESRPGSADLPRTSTSRWAAVSLTAWIWPNRSRSSNRRCRLRPLDRLGHLERGGVARPHRVERLGQPRVVVGQQLVHPLVGAVADRAVGGQQPGVGQRERPGQRAEVVAQRHPVARGLEADRGRDVREHVVAGEHDLGRGVVVDDDGRGCGRGCAPPAASASAGPGRCRRAPSGRGPPSRRTWARAAPARTAGRSGPPLPACAGSPRRRPGGRRCR